MTSTDFDLLKGWEIARFGHPARIRRASGSGGLNHGGR